MYGDVLASPYPYLINQFIKKSKNVLTIINKCAIL